MYMLDCCNGQAGEVLRSVSGTSCAKVNVNRLTILVSARTSGVVTCTFSTVQAQQIRWCISPS
jgi:hypothetical protein